MIRAGPMLVFAFATAALAWPARLTAATDQAVAPDLRAVPRPPVFDLDARSARPASAAAPSGNPLWAVPLSTLTATRERPIFSASRRPPAPPAAARPIVQVRPPPPRAVEPRPRMSLVGTVAGAEGIAVFVDQTTQAIVRLHTGEGHEGWILRAVGTHQVTLQNDRDTAILVLPPVNGK